MSSNQEIIEFKRLIINKIIHNETLINLINEQGITIDNADELIDNNIFRYDRVPNTEGETKTYITIKVDILRINPRNDLYKDILITLRLVTHQNTVKLNNYVSNKLDDMSVELSKLLNGSMEFGVDELKLTSDYEDKVDLYHPCRVIRFVTEGFNKGCS